VNGIAIGLLASLLGFFALGYGYSAEGIDPQAALPAMLVDLNLFPPNDPNGEAPGPRYVAAGVTLVPIVVVFSWFIAGFTFCAVTLCTRRLPTVTVDELFVSASAVALVTIAIGLHVALFLNPAVATWWAPMLVLDIIVGAIALVVVVAGIFDS
jgi:hypothetical protein